MDLLLWSLALLASLGCLVKASDYFLGAAERVGLGFGLSPFIVGVTIVAFGTSFPELVSGVVAVLEGASEIAVGTAVGSNVTNILLILGLAAVVGGGMKVAYELVRVDLPFLFGSSLALMLFAFDGSIGRVEGLLSLLALSIYLAYAVSSPDEPSTTVALSAVEVAREPPRRRPGWRTWLTILASGALIHVGAHFTVVSTLRVSELLGVGSEIIATSAIALGTSLPELIVSIRSAAAGKPEISIGNVIGSNVFNALGVIGVAALVGTLSVPSVLSTFALPVMIGVTVLGFFVLQEQEVTRWDGGLLLVLYVAFITQLVGLS
jgi:cation:H+ antiporter